MQHLKFLRHNYCVHAEVKISFDMKCIMVFSLHAGAWNFCHIFLVSMPTYVIPDTASMLMHGIS